MDWPLNPGPSFVKPLQLGCADSQMLLAQQREGAGASHIIFKMTVTKTPLVKKNKLCKQETPTFV